MIGLIACRGVHGRAVAAIATLVAALFLAACGGSDESEPGERSAPQSTGTGASDAPSKEEFLSQGDAICAEVQSEAAELAQRAQELESQSGTLPKSEVLAGAAAVWDDQIRVISAFRDDFEALGAPAGDDERVEQFIESLDDSLGVAREIRATLRDGEEVPQALVDEYGQLVVRGNTLAQSYGFRVCGQTE
jgi:hypothetical protein